VASANGSCKEEALHDFSFQKGLPDEPRSRAEGCVDAVGLIFVGLLSLLLVPAKRFAELQASRRLALGETLPAVHSAIRISL
jgi:hypothetical protein